MSGEGRTHVQRVIVPLVALVGVLAACGGGGGDEPPACEDPRATTEVTMGDFYYEPTCVEAAGGTELDVVNEGQAPHTFTVEGTVEGSGGSAEVDVPAGERATFTTPALTEGTYRVTCTYHPQMEAALRITAATP
jgi:plastocyanin